MRRRFVPLLIFLPVALLVLTAAAPVLEAGGGGHGACAGPPRGAAGQRVDIANNCYSPAVLYAQPGAPVTWVNNDYYGHNVVTFDGELLGEQEPFFQGNVSGLEEGETLVFAFDEPGVFPYYCSIHPSMFGVVVVGDPAEAAVSLDTTALSDLPAPSAHEGSSQPSWAIASGADAGTGNDERGANDGGGGWSVAALGLGLFGGVAVGLVAVGGGVRLRRWLR